MRALRPLCLLLAAPLGAAPLGACAHADAERQESPPTAETTVLNERIRHLEKRVSDLDAQVALLTERLASSQGGVVAAASPRRAPSYEPVREEEIPRHTYEPGLRSIDLSAPESVSTGGLAPATLELGAPRESADPYQPVESPASDGVVVESEATRAPEGPPDDVKGAYAWAHARMEEGRYLEAIAAFEGILERHREHDLADNALYWTAVCHDKRGDPRLAISVFQKLPMQFPRSPKLPDALFGMASAHEALGEPVLAETLYAQLVQLYPRAEKAPKARQALRRLEGR